MSTQGERLRLAIELAGFKKVAPFAESIGFSPIKVRQHINRESIPTDAAEVYVRRLRQYGVTTDWLLFDRGPAPKGLAKLPTEARQSLERPPGAFVEVTHVVGAGAEVFPISTDGGLGWIKAPPGYEQGGAVSIDGESGRPLFDETDILFYRGWEPPPTSTRKLNDKPVLIELVDGRSLLKKLLPGSKRTRFHLLSINPATPTIYDAEIKAVAYIGWVYFGGKVDIEHAE